MVSDGRSGVPVGGLPSRFCTAPGLLFFLSHPYADQPAVKTPHDGADKPDGKAINKRRADAIEAHCPGQDAEHEPVSSEQKLPTNRAATDYGDLLPSSGEEGQDANHVSSELYVQIFSHCAQEETTKPHYPPEISDNHEVVDLKPDDVESNIRSYKEEKDDGKQPLQLRYESVAHGFLLAYHIGDMLLPVVAHNVKTCKKNATIPAATPAYMVHMCVFPSRNAAAYLLAQPRANPKVKQKAEAEQKDVMEAMDNKWSEIAARLVGSTDNDVKNLWDTQIKRQLNRFHNYNAKQQMRPTDMSAKQLDSSFRVPVHHRYSPSSPVPHNLTEGQFVQEMLKRGDARVRSIHNMMEKLIRYNESLASSDFEGALQHTTSSLALSLNASLSDAGHDDELRAALMNKNLPFTPLRGRNRYQGHEMQKSNVMQRKTRMQMRLFYLKKDVLDPG